MDKREWEEQALRKNRRACPNPRAAPPAGARSQGVRYYLLSPPSLRVPAFNPVARGAKSLTVCVARRQSARLCNQLEEGRAVSLRAACKSLCVPAKRVVLLRN